MGLIFDSSVFIARERRRFDLEGFLRANRLENTVAIAALTVSELLHGWEREEDLKKKEQRQIHIQDVLATYSIAPFGLPEARIHARIWAGLATKGELIGPHDMIIAATALSIGFEMVTLNAREFSRVPGLRLMDTSRFMTTL